MLQARDRLILALDFPSAGDCFRFLSGLSEGLQGTAGPRWVKVGLELFLAAGPGLVAKLKEQGYEVFLDLKLHDIPNTVAGAVRSVLPLAPALLTVHAAGGPAMLFAAAEAAAGSSTRLVAVSVLTSMDAAQLTAVGVLGSPAAQVERLARLAFGCGIQSLVCSPWEARLLRAALPQAHLITPGIRPQGSPADDQQRISTPFEALRCGADQLVVGRPITGAQDPARAFLALLHELEGAGGD